MVGADIIDQTAKARGGGVDGDGAVDDGRVTRQPVDNVAVGVKLVVGTRTAKEHRKAGTISGHRPDAIAAKGCAKANALGEHIAKEQRVGGVDDDDAPSAWVRVAGHRGAHPGAGGVGDHLVDDHPSGTAVRKLNDTVENDARLYRDVDKGLALDPAGRSYGRSYGRREDRCCAHQGDRPKKQNKNPRSPPLEVG